MRNRTSIYCPLTDKELIFVRIDQFVMDPTSYYSPIGHPEIEYTRHPFAWREFHYGKRIFFLNREDVLIESIYVAEKLRPLPKYTITKIKYSLDEFRYRTEIQISRIKRRLSDFWKYKILRRPDNRVYLPIIPKFLPRTIASELVKVEPMQAPIGKLPYFDHIYLIEPDLWSDKRA